MRSGRYVVRGLVFTEKAAGIFETDDGQWSLWLDMHYPRHPWRISQDGKTRKARYSTPDQAVMRVQEQIKRFENATM